MFYWKTKEDLPIFSIEKMTAIFVATCIIMTSVLALLDLIIRKTGEDT